MLYLLLLLEVLGQKSTAGNGIGTVTFYHSKTPDGNIAAAKVGIATTTSATDTVVLQNGLFTLSGNVHTFSAFLKGEEVRRSMDDTSRYCCNVITIKR